MVLKYIGIKTLGLGEIFKKITNPEMMRYQEHPVSSNPRHVLISSLHKFSLCVHGLGYLSNIINKFISKSTLDEYE